MPEICPPPAPTDPLFQGLLSSTDCQVQALVRVGYGALNASASLAQALAAALTVSVALVGLRLMLGRPNWSVSDYALNMVKLAAVIALATQWPLYERIILDTLFHGPEQLADILQRGGGRPIDPRGPIAGLQHAFDDLTIFSPAAPPGPTHRDPNSAVSLPTSLPQYMTPAAHDALLFLIAALILLFSTLGMLLAAKLILGLLLAPGPIFVALFLFESTRGVFVGWLRASLAAALLPLFAFSALGVSLLLLRPALSQIELMNDTEKYIPGVGAQVMVLAFVTLVSTFGLIVATGFIAAGFQLPRLGRKRSAQGRQTPIVDPVPVQSRTGAIAVSLALQDRTRMRFSSAAPEQSQPPMGRRDLQLATPASNVLARKAGTPRERAKRRR